MSNELPTGDGWNSASNAHSASIPLYPGEKPTYRDLQQWSISAKNILNRTIFGPALRGETPPQLMALTGKRDVGITVLTAEQREKCSPLDIARYDQMVAKAKMDEDVRLKQLAIGEKEYKNKLAALLESALRPKAGLLLRRLQTAHKDLYSDTYDGVAMWKELIAQADEPSTLAEKREHDRVIEAARDTPLQDGCTAQEFSDKINKLLTDHLPYGTHKYEGQDLGLFIFELLPDANRIEKRIAITEMQQAGCGIADSDKVIKRCTEIVRASARTATTPIAAIQQLEAALANVGVDATAIANLTASLTNKTNNGKSNGKSRKGDDKSKPNKFRLPEGQLCSWKTCNLAHDKFSPGTPCLRSHLFPGPPPQQYRKNQKQLARLEQDRKANALRAGLPYKPMVLSTPPTAAAVPIVDAFDDPSDVFQLPTAICPVVPALRFADMPPVCSPCDESQWVDLTDDEDSDLDEELTVPPTPVLSTIPSTDFVYLTPTRTDGDSGPDGSLALQAQWVNSSDDDDDEDDARDVAPPPPPSKLAQRSRASPTTTAALRALAEPDTEGVDHRQVPQLLDHFFNDFAAMDENHEEVVTCQFMQNLDRTELDLPSDSQGIPTAAVDAGDRARVASKAPPAAARPARSRSPLLWLLLAGAVGAAIAVSISAGFPLVSAVSHLSMVAAGVCNGPFTWSGTMGPAFANASLARIELPRPPLPMDFRVRCYLLGAFLLSVRLFSLLVHFGAGAARTAGRGARRAASAVLSAARAIASRTFMMVLILMLGPQRGAAAISPASASRVSGLVNMLGRSCLGGPQAARAASAIVRDRYDLAILPGAPDDLCLRLGRGLGLSCEPVPVMNAATGTFSTSDLAVGVRPRGLHLADSGAGIHAINDPRYIVPGSLRPNTTAVATANGVTVPPHRCDAALSVRTQGGSVRRLELKDAVLLPDCQHSLVSLGLLARDAHASTTISAGTSESFIQLADGTKITLVNSGVLILPDATVPAAALRSYRRGADAPAAKRSPAGTVSYETLHNRFNGRSHQTLRHLATAVRGPPRSWLRALAKSPSDFCEACLRARADKLHSSAHAPAADAPGSVSYDIYEAGVPHIHGGHRYIIGFHDKYSTLNKVYNLQSKSHAHLAMDMYYAWASSHGVKIFRFHADNAGELTGDKLKEKWAARGVRITACAPHEPRGNGLMERQWRTMGNDTRHSLALSGLPAGYYYYLLKAAVQASWSIPINAAETPWSRFTGKPAPALYLRVPGCLAYYKVLKPANKMAMRARRAVHLGRAEDQPAYLLLDIESRSIVTTPHVRFVEDVFPGLSGKAGDCEPTEAEVDTLFRRPLIDGAGDDDGAPDAPGGRARTPSMADGIRSTATDTAVASSSGDVAASSGGRMTAAPTDDTAARVDSMFDDVELADDDGRAPDDYGLDDFSGAADGRAPHDGHISSRLSRPSLYRPAAPPLAIAVPTSGSYWLYIGSGPRRDGDLASQMAALGGAPVVNIDIKVGGYDHDLTYEPVRVEVLKLARDARCLGAFISIPCKTFSVLRGKSGVEHSKPVRDLDNVLGIPREDGSLPWNVVESNTMSELAAGVMAAVHSQGGIFVAESPPSRAAGSRFPIEGRERHASQFDHPSWMEVCRSAGARFIYFDQCSFYDDPAMTSPKKTAFMASPRAYDAFHRRFAPLVCTHPKGSHKTMYGIDDNGNFMSPSSENYSPKMNALIAEALCEAAGSRRTRSASAAALDPVARWQHLYEPSSSIMWCDSPSATSVPSPYHWLSAAMPLLGRDLTARTYETGVDGQLFAATRKSDSDSPSYRKARSSDDWPKWQDALEGEINNLRRNGTIDEDQAVPEDMLPTWDAIKGRASQVVNILWVLKVKYVDGALDKYKARAVFDGRSQKVKDPTLETFSPACRSTTFKLAVAEACRLGLRLLTWDVEAAYLKGKFPDGAETLYARPPPGYRKYVNGIAMIWVLKTPLYGEADAGRIWYQTFLRFMLAERAFTQSRFDPCLLWKTLSNGSRMTIVLYVDDGISSDDGSLEADAELEAINAKFKILVKPAKFFLGNNIDVHSDGRITLSSRAYINRMIERYLHSPESRGPTSTPCERRIVADYEEAIQLRREPQSSAADAALREAYPSKVGALIYCVPASRVDCAYAIGMLARCLTFPTERMNAAADRCLTYLHQHDAAGITYDPKCSRPELYAYSDSDWSTSHSTSGWVILYAGAAIGYGSKRQQSVALSTTEAEIMAASQAASEIMYFRGILQELGRELDPTVLYVDNQGAVELSKDLKSCKRSRHIERRYLKIRELVADGEILVRHVSSEENHADMLTKPLDSESFEYHFAALSGGGSVCHRGGC